jgi:hypothetical protein
MTGKKSKGFDLCAHESCLTNVVYEGGGARCPHCKQMFCWAHLHNHVCNGRRLVDHNNTKDKKYGKQKQMR